jgi:hypothetical protein
MKLTPENKAHIDGLTQIKLLHGLRFTPPGDPWFTGETGDYWCERVARLQRENPGGHVAASKSIGWGR